MFNRTVVSLLKDWKNNPARKPLVLRGARQVGKTTAVHIFAEEFDNYIYLNMELAEDRKIFREEFSIKELFQAILVIKNISLKEGDTLIFIDEIQSSPVAVKILRYFYEELKELYVIAAGSLLEIVLERDDISFPVGRIEYMFMYPLSFREFLEATQEVLIINEFNTVPIKKIAFTKLLSLFHEYTLVGGMPEAVKNYIDSNAVSDLRPVYESLMISYTNDSEKYARNPNARNVLRHCIETIPFEAGNRIKFHGFGKSNYKSREVGEALRVIERAMLIYLIYPSTSFQTPVIPDYKKSPKLQFFDTGLLNYFAGIQQNFFKYDDLHSFYKGLIAEHIVRQELICADLQTNKKTPFWVREKKQSSSEVDILLEYNNYIIPLEIKAGKTGTLRSLHQFINNSDFPYAVRLYSGNIEIVESKTPEGKSYKLLNLPYFLISKINDYLDFFINK